MQLEIDVGGGIGHTDSLDDLDTTFRIGVMSIGGDNFRVAGKTIKQDVKQSELEIGKRIGSGACSSVHIATHKNTGESYAVKIFNVYDRERTLQLKQELEILLEMKCEAMATFYGAFYNEGSIGVILEFMDLGSLDNLMDSRVRISDQVLAAITYQTAWGLAYLHYDNNMHRDLKPGNLLMNTIGEVKLSDFGIARKITEDKTSTETFTGTFKFMSPERLNGDAYWLPADIWSLGVMMMQLWEKRYPFERGNYSPLELLDVFENMKLVDFLSVDKYPNPLMKAAITSMLAINPTDRVTANQLLDCPWVLNHGITSIAAAQDMVFDWIEESHLTAFIGKDSSIASSGQSRSGSGIEAKTVHRLGGDRKHGAKDDDEDPFYSSDQDDCRFSQAGEREREHGRDSQDDTPKMAHGDRYSFALDDDDTDGGPGVGLGMGRVAESKISRRK